MELRIKELRNIKKMNQDELSELSGVSKRSISYYEKNEKYPTLDTALKIATGLGVSLNDLIIGYSKEDSTVVIMDNKENGSEYFLQMIKENVDKLSDKDREILELKKKIEILKTKINKELKRLGRDPLD